MKHLLIRITLSTVALCGASFAAENPVKSAAPGKAYVYKTSGGKERQMELFFPPNHDPAKSKVPGIIFFHGGAWLGGSLGEFRSTCAYFASRGPPRPATPLKLAPSLDTVVWRIKCE